MNYGGRARLLTPAGGYGEFMAEGKGADSLSEEKTSVALHARLLSLTAVRTSGESV